MKRKFFDTLSTLSMYPQITLPTRFSNSNGTLIDNFFCKHSAATLNFAYGILLKKFLDHQPYVISLSLVSYDKPLQKIH